MTKEITCAGIKISDIKTLPIKLPKNKSVTTKIEKQIFIQFNQSECKVNILLFLHNNMKNIFKKKYVEISVLAKSLSYKNEI